MKHSLRSITFLTVLLLLTVTFLVACGSGGDTGSSSSDNGSNQSSGTTDTSTASAGDPTAGKDLYQKNCLACHGEEGQGGHNGPNLQDSSKAHDFESVVAQINNGGETMPSFKDKLTDEEKQDLAAYITEVVAKKSAK